MLSAFSSKDSNSDGMGVHKCIWYGQLACCSPSDEMLNQGPDSLWLLKITGCLSKRVEV